MMTAILRAVFLSVLILIYGFIFSAHEQKMSKRILSLEYAKPVNYYRITAGYLKQLAAEMLFVRTSVFLGGVLSKKKPPANYEETLGNNFEVMTQLYPRFIAPYFYVQAFLPHISLQAAAKSNRILETGISAYPNDLFLRFMYAVNYFLSMNEPLKAAQAFTEAAKLPKAPPLFGHLAVLLSARGGDIAAGLISLKTMLAAEKDELVRSRYKEEIVIFEQAMKVQKGLKAYTNKYGSAPKDLEKLVPEFLPQLPKIKDSFTLIYDPPNVHLQRPDRM